MAAVPVGCRVGLNLVNVQAYADDIVLLSPSVSGLQALLDTFCEAINCLKLVINCSKTFIVPFTPRSRPCNNRFNVYIDNTVVSINDKYKYLGCIFSNNDSESLDMERCLNAFNRSFGGLISKFPNLNIDMLMYLFQMYCLSFYGAELWINRRRSRAIFNRLSISYHAALKRIIGVPKFYSNHIVCGILGKLTFEHFINLKITKYFFWIRNCNSPCIVRHKYYLLNTSFISQYVNSTWLKKYNVPNVLNNDIQALIARIYYIQNREPSSMFVGL